MLAHDTNVQSTHNIIRLYLNHFPQIKHNKTFVIAYDAMGRFCWCLSVKVKKASYWIFKLNGICLLVFLLNCKLHAFTKFTCYIMIASFSLGYRCENGQTENHSTENHFLYTNIAHRRIWDHSNNKKWVFIHCITAIKKRSTPQHRKVLCPPL